MKIISIAALALMFLIGLSSIGFASPSFQHVSYYRGLKGLIYSGSLLDGDGKGISGAKVTLSCNGVEIDGPWARTNPNGRFMIPSTKACATGDTFLLHTELGSEEVKSSPVTIIDPASGREVNRYHDRIPEPGTAYTPGTTSHFGVPEFSTTTLGLAVFAVGFGIAYLRKKR